MSVDRPEQLIDPVCGMTVNVAKAEANDLLLEHEGRWYAFCRSGCRRAFLEDPAEYVAAAEQAAGARRRSRFVAGPVRRPGPAGDRRGDASLVRGLLLLPGRHLSRDQGPARRRARRRRLRPCRSGSARSPRLPRRPSPRRTPELCSLLPGTGHDDRRNQYLTFALGAVDGPGEGGVGWLHDNGDGTTNVTDFVVPLPARWPGR